MPNDDLTELCSSLKTCLEDLHRVSYSDKIYFLFFLSAVFFSHLFRSAPLLSHRLSSLLTLCPTSLSSLIYGVSPDLPTPISGIIMVKFDVGSISCN